MNGGSEFRNDTRVPSALTTKRRNSATLHFIREIFPGCENSIRSVAGVTAKKGKLFPNRNKVWRNCVFRSRAFAELSRRTNYAKRPPYEYVIWKKLIPPM